MRCEYLVNPQGINTAQPRFSWIIASDGRSVYQQSYRIIVGDNLFDVRHCRGNCWDSGVSTTDNTVNIVYEGKPLASDRTYYWRVVSVINGKETLSETAEFHTGMLSPSDWKAKWISTREEIVAESPLLRKVFKIEKAVEKAYIYSAAAGFYELYLNDAKVGDEIMNPSVSDYRKTVLYSVYDVSNLLKEGDNAFGVMLGNGAYNMRRYPDRWSWHDSRSMGNPCFLLQLNIKYKDGGETTVTSGEGWKYTAGPVTFNDMYGGEDYDARKEITGWAGVGLDDSAWKEAAVVAGPGGKLEWQALPIKVTATLKPIARTHPSKGVYLFDLGQNFAGWWRITVKGTAGQTVRIRGAETLNDRLFPKNLEEGDTLSGKFRYHSHTWTDYTLKNDELTTWEPHFFYSGFRYVEVVTSDKADLASLEVEGRVTGSDLETNGEWTSSNELLNKIYSAGLWSQKSNLVGYPTDCPHREKGAYNGDGQVIAEASMHDFNMSPFYAKWLNDMRDSQEPNGRIPNTSPIIVGGMGGGVAWGSAYILIPWWMYQYYNDTRMLQEHYPTMKRYIEYLHKLAQTDKQPDQPYIINYFDGYWYSLGEWCSPGRSDCPNHDVVNTFYYYYDTRLMSEIAELLGYKDDKKQYEALSDTIKEAFNATFLRPETSIYGLDSVFQTYQLLAIVGNLVPSDNREKVLKTIVDDIKARGNHLNTGIIGTKYLWPTLSDAGYDDLAWSVATQETYPSFGYWIRNNCTTLLEQWDGANSHNHQMFGTITEYFYQYLAGIRPPTRDGTTNAYKHINLQPYMPDDLDMAQARLRTVSGQIVSRWEKQGKGYKYEATVPANTTATIILPAKDAVVLTESGKILWQNGRYVGGVSGVKNVKLDNEKFTIDIESGSYNFTNE
ncbi:MAG: glycoside hydrolase family 78 protein [Tannerella sp.]|nr:glycoside hydrolase family 78 protein [Tannerella sp.]